MKNKFINKLNNHEYISKSLYYSILDYDKTLIPDNFNIDQYNEEVLNKEYVKHKDYFENMYKGIDDSVKLDEEQSKAIIADEEYALIIAGAGTGKTITMTSKVKYLIDFKNVDPSKILVMSYTKKAVNELLERIVYGFNIPAKVTTFHSLGLEYIRKIFTNKKCVVISENEKRLIFLEYIKTKFINKNEIKLIVDSFQHLRKGKSIFGNFFKENYDKYNNWDEFFNAYKKNKMSEAKNRSFEKIIQEYKDNNLVSENIRTIKGELVKSGSEMTIANYLFSKGIDYVYEEISPEVMEDYRTYRPDFTLDLAGQKVYLEYYGMNSLGYNRIKELKRNFHLKNKNLYIEIDRTSIDELENILDQKLREMGFIYNLKTDEEIYERILDNNPLAQIFNFQKMLDDWIGKIKSSLKREKYREIVNNYINTLEEKERKQVEIQFNYIDEFYRFYEKRLYANSDIYYFDYPDLLYYANKYIDRVSRSKIEYDYIIIDEYQDISKSRYELVKNTVDKNGSKVFAVGDDWQSIFAFSGSRIEYLYDFEKYFSRAKLFKISKTYRNSQELIDYSGKFIMKNESQIKKNLSSDKHSINPIRFVKYDNSNFLNEVKPEIDVLKQIILEIYKKNPNYKILILGRTNSIIKSLFADPDLKDDIDTKITFIGHEDIQIDGMTMHKSKGLTFDEVIVIGLNKDFPRENYGVYWLEELFDNALYDEEYAFAEERRLFYVALTRTKNHVFLLTNINREKRSSFLDELYLIINQNSQ